MRWKERREFRKLMKRWPQVEIALEEIAPGLEKGSGEKCFLEGREVLIEKYKIVSWKEDFPRELSLEIQVERFYLEDATLAFKRKRDFLLRKRWLIVCHTSYNNQK